MDASSKKRVRKTQPAKTLEGRENQVIALAVDLAEKQLKEGIASSQVIVHFLKLATTREKLEKEKLIKENLLLSARTEALQSVKRVEELYANALDAMRSYKSIAEDSEEIDD